MRNLYKHLIIWVLFSMNKILFMIGKVELLLYELIVLLLLVKLPQNLHNINIILW